MVKINNYHQRTNDDNENFYVLELLGDLEFVQSKTTGKLYAKRSKVYIPTVFNEEGCKDLVGATIPGKIIKEKCDPYEYIIKQTGERITLHFKYVFEPEEMEEPSWMDALANLRKEAVKADSKTFSSNGVH